MSKNTNIADLINYISVDGSGNVVLTTGGQVATQSYVTTAVSNLVNAAPSTLDTLNELAAALGNDANFATTLTTSIATKQAQLNGTGFVKVSGTTVSYDNSTYLTTTSASSNYVTLSTLQTISGLKTFDATISANYGIALLNGAIPALTSIYYAALSGNSTGISITYRTGGGINYTNNLNFPDLNNSYLFPSTSGTLALTSSLSAYLPLTGGTLTGALNGTSATFSTSIGIGSGTNSNDILHIIKSGITTYAAMRVNNNNSTAELYVGVGGSAVANTTLQNNAYIMNAGASGLALGTSDIVRMFITTSGNVGIRNNNAYSPLTVTGAGISWGETVTYYPASNGYITLAFRLEGTDTTTGTWAIGKQSTIENGGVQYLQIAKNGLTGSTLHRPDAVQSFDPANGNAYFGFNVGVGTTSPFNFGSIHRTLDVRGSSTSSIGALFVGNSNRTSVLGFYINPAAGGTVGTSSNHFLQLVTNDVERIRIGTNGNVGIANDNPLSRLHIGPEGSVGGNTPVIVMSSAAGTKPSMLITEYTARSGAFGYDNNNFLTLATETGVTAGIKLKVGSSFGGGLLNTGTDAIIINTSGQVQRPNQPAFLAYSTGFTVTGGIWQLISNNINTETYDIGSNYSSGRFTAPVAGRYLFYFGGWANISSNNGDRYAVSFPVNGGGYLYLCGGNYSSTDSPLSGATIIYNLNAGDYVELHAFSIIGGTWGGGHSIWWGGYLL